MYALYVRIINNLLNLKKTSNIRNANLLNVSKLLQIILIYI